MKCSLFIYSLERTTNATPFQTTQLRNNYYKASTFHRFKVLAFYVFSDPFAVALERKAAWSVSLVPVSTSKNSSLFPLSGFLAEFHRDVEGSRIYLGSPPWVYEPLS